MARDPHDNRTGQLAAVPSSPDRQRISVELSPAVSALLDHIIETTGQTKAAIVGVALLDALPELVARADALKKRNQELLQVRRK